MRPDVQILLSGCLTFGVPLAIAVRELLVLRRGDGPGWEPPAEPPPAPLPLAPQGRELPACLRPDFAALQGTTGLVADQRVAAGRVKILEPV